MPSSSAAESRYAYAFDLLERAIQALARVESHAGRNHFDRLARRKQEPLGGLNAPANQVLVRRRSKHLAEHADEMVPRHLRCSSQGPAVDLQKVLHVDHAARRFEPLPDLARGPLLAGIERVGNGLASTGRRLGNAWHGLWQLRVVTDANGSIGRPARSYA